MRERAKLEKTEDGIVPQDEGWHILNAAECRWYKSEKFGWASDFAGEKKWEHLGAHIHIVQPGQPACHYHSEGDQEDFFVLSGEGKVIIEEEEIPLKQWDFVHCPPGVRHVFVGAGDGPCVILMMGTRSKEEEILYPRSEAAAKHGASVKDDTPDPKVSYADCPPWTVASSPPPWPEG